MTTLLGLELAGRTVLIAGGGAVAARRARTMLEDGAHLRVVAPQVGPEMARLLDVPSVGDAAPVVTWIRRGVVAQDLADVWLVLAATDDPAVNRDVCRWAQQRHLWCIDAGAAGRGSARTPATTRSADLVLGVSTDAGPARPHHGAGDADPRRVAAVRDAVSVFLAAGGADQRRRRPGPGRVTLVGGGPGAVDLITVRGRQALAQADVVVTDRLGPVELLAELPEEVEVIDVGKAPGNHHTPQERINDILITQARAGRQVVRLKGGDPFIYGRGGEEVLACRAAGLPVEVVPGVSSALSVPGLAGIPLTHRGTVGAFHVATGHDGLDEAALVAVRSGTATLVILMGVSQLARIADQALAAGAAPDTPVAIVERGSTPEQRVIRAPLELIAEHAAAQSVRNPAVIVCGAVAATDLLMPAGYAGLVPAGDAGLDTEGHPVRLGRARARRRVRAVQAI